MTSVPGAADPAGSDPSGAEADAERHQRWVANLTAVAIIGFSLSWVVLTFLIDRRVYGGPTSAVDVSLYRTYAQNVLTGMLPYRDFAFEYPPLALVPILLPVLLGGTPFEPTRYRQMFQLVEAAFGMLTMIMIMWSVSALGRGRRDMLAAAAMVAASPFLLGPLILSRYDLFPALFAAAATWLLVTHRPRWAAVALALGVAAKIYPIVLGPFAFAYLWRTAGRREAMAFVGISAIVVLAVVAPFFLLAPEGVTEALSRAFRRPIQVESLGASFLYLREVLTGQHIRFVHTFDSYNLRGPIADAVGTVHSVVLGLALLAAFWLFVRGRPTLDRLVLAFAAALTAWVAFGRVFSPQYLIWLIAPLAVVASRRWSLLQVSLVVAILLTGLYYPRAYNAYYAHAEAPWVAVVLGRNLVLVALTVYLLVMLRPRGDPEQEAGAGAGAPPGAPPGPPPGAAEAPAR